MSGACLQHVVTRLRGLYEQLSAEDNLRFYGRGWPGYDLEKRIKELLTHMGLWDRPGEAVVK